ncbi:hypothetical protein N7468_008478 [Penicillium chermesinum]|uniref:F5/8 type C domain-containing protein n=1 Tax=Penicillium chermesinum TaxID=63820 RepID=A0A9W9NPU3_9EURO|nr:uncharacterized protein N7468_008478 [Penicillium chermesinum]KAJ5223936.1 hypothetical protein N7468_008478 [Penicillium chermesinum]
MSLKNLALLLAVGLARAEGQDSTTAAAPFNPYTNDASSFNQSPPLGQRIKRRKWSAQCDSSDGPHQCENAIDPESNDYWQSGSGAQHEIVVDLGETRSVNAIEVAPAGQDGWIEGHQVYVSTDKANWGPPVSFGTWNSDGSIKVSIFNPKSAQYVRLMSDKSTTSIADLNIWEYTIQGNVDAEGGVWGPTVDLPIIAVAGAVVPETGEVMVWSAYTSDNYANSPSGYSLLAVWDPTTNSVTQRNVTETHHDMFCPGISWDGSGKLVISGGSDASRTSFLYPNQSWVAGPSLHIARGYQSSATLSTGEVFVVGGAWNGGATDKYGEVYSPITNKWSDRKGCDVIPMLTDDKQGIYRADNHGWFFGWKNETVFQAGPSKQMNWYHTQGNGNVSPAGTRANADDAMSGNAVMYDAVAGKIITFGGSPQLRRHRWRTWNELCSCIPYICCPPDGNVFLTGGQKHGIPFNEDGALLTPELYLAPFNLFQTQTPNSVIRVYHSISLLLTDGRVFNGGGGLCGNCTANHLDAQIYTPRYLLNGDGSLATRPEITSVANTEVKPGDKLSFQTGGSINSASLVRYGTASHTVNTDQRRVPLDIGNGEGTNHEATLPSDASILLPGWWMLFVMNDEGTPSISKTIKVNPL